MGEHGAVPCAACGGAVFLMRIKENFLLNEESDSPASTGHTHHFKMDAGSYPESATPTWRPKEPMRSEQEGHLEHFQDLTANQTSFTAVVFGRPERAALPAPRHGNRPLISEVSRHIIVRARSRHKPPPHVSTFI